MRSRKVSWLILIPGKAGSFGSLIRRIHVIRKRFARELAQATDWQNFKWAHQRMKILIGIQVKVLKETSKTTRGTRSSLIRLRCINSVSQTGSTSVLHQITKRKVKLRPGNRDVSEHPVVNVCWHDAWCFAKWLGSLNVDGQRHEINLPSEAQWEYACRCGETTAFTWPDRTSGDQIKLGDANFDGSCPWPQSESKDQSDTVKLCLEDTISVAGSDDELTIGPNPWGLHQMHGNVWEWCNDWYERYDVESEKNELRLNPGGPIEGSTRVLRGGSWFDFGYRLRSASRGRVTPSFRASDHGFRLAAVPEPSK